MAHSLQKTLNSTRVLLPWNTIALTGVLCIAVVLLFYNVAASPPVSNDEGFYLSIAKTIAVDGVYGSRNADGYQTYGVTQSIGAPVILPIALSFKLFGVGVLQARVVMALFALLALALVYGAARVLFGPRAALVSVLLLLGSGTSFVAATRQTMGEVPALGFFLAGWWVWVRAMRTRRRTLYPIAGVLLGLAMITKSQYLIIGLGTLAALVVLDLCYYKQGGAKALIAVAGVSVACVAAWLGWQLAYFGPATFWTDTDKLRRLASITTGFHISWTVEALQYLLGPASNHFYFFWGFPALAYACLLCKRRAQDSLILAFLVIFTIFWLGFFLFWSLPWWRYALTPIFIAVMLVAKLWHDLTAGFQVSLDSLRAEWQSGQPAKAALTLVALIALVLIVVEPIQKAARLNIYAGDATQGQVAQFLDANIPKDATIETWERELGILTDHNYHFPDPSLNQASTAAFLSGARDYTVGGSYFQQHQVAYLVVGKFARSTGAYDMHYLAQASCLLTTVGAGDDRYDIYRLTNIPNTGSDVKREQATPCR